jgi:hypothetical protein
MAAWLGAEVLSVTIEPDFDDGPQRDGDAAVRWHHAKFSERELLERELMTVLAGPVAEMVHQERRLRVDSLPEWADDWRLACEIAGSMLNLSRKKHSVPTRDIVDAVTIEVFRLISQNAFWQTIAEVADLLDAHETLGGEEVADCIERWLGRFQ